MKEHPNGIVQDWSHHYALYPRYGEIHSLIAVQNEPRALQSWQAAARLNWRRYYGGFRTYHHPHSTLQTDWSISLGTGGMAQSMYPAKFGFSTVAAPNCTNDFVVFTVDAAGGAAQPNIVGFNQLYSGTTGGAGICNRVPSGSDTGLAAEVMWSYNVTAAGGHAPTSPALSLDGTRIAFVESASATTAHFHVLAWKSGDGKNNSNLQDVTAPKQITSGFSATAPAAGSGTATDLALGSTSDTLSSVFVDYANDRAYVGNDAGVIFRIVNVFCTTVACTGGGSPAPSLDATWGTAGALTIGGTCTGRVTGVVVDGGTGHVFAGCADGNLYGYTSAGLALTNPSVTVGSSGTDGGVVDPPLVDAVNGFVYAAAGNSGSATQVIVQAKSTDLSSARIATMGVGGSFNLHAPAFNDKYFSSATNTDWILYIPALSTTLGQSGLYGITFAAGHVMNTGTPTNLDTFGFGATEFSPATSFLTTLGEDRLFESFLKGTGGNLASFNITSTFPFALESNNSPSVGNGTTGIIVDNDASSTAQANSVYFGALGANNAVKLTQSALQ